MLGFLCETCVLVYVYVSVVYLSGLIHLNLVHLSVCVCVCVYENVCIILCVWNRCCAQAYESLADSVQSALSRAVSRKYSERQVVQVENCAFRQSGSTMSQPAQL